MNAAGLNIIVTSNTQSAVAGINQVTNSLNNAGRAAAAAGSGVGNATAAVNRLAPVSAAAAAGITNLAAAVRAGQASLAGVPPTVQQTSGALVRLNRDLMGTSAVMRGFANDAKLGRLSFVGLNGALSNAGKGTQSANSALHAFGKTTSNTGQIAMNFGRILSDLPYGFIAIQNNIDPLLQSLGMSAGIGLAFTIASSAAVVLAQKYGGLGAAISALNPFTTAAEKAQSAYNAALEKGAKDAAGEVSNLNLLFAAAKDLNVPLAERQRIVKELQNLFPQTFKDLTAEKVAAGQADEAYRGLVKQLLALASVRAGTEVINKLGGQLLNLQLEATKLDQQLDKLRKTSGNPSLSNPFGADPVKAARQIDAVQNDINRNKAAQVDLEKQAAAIQAEQLKLIEKFGATAAGVNEIKDPAVKKEHIKDIRDATDVVDELALSVFKTNAIFVRSGNTLTQLTENQIKNFEDALKGLIDVGVLPGDQLFDQLKSRLDDLRSVQQPVKVTIPIAPDFSIPKAVSNSIMTKDQGLALLATSFKPQVNAFTANLNNIIQTSIEGGIGSISEALGNALVTGDIGSLLGSFINSIASFMQKLGVSLIATGVGIEAFKASLESLSGATAIIAGIGLVAAAAAFKAIASGGVGSFATGGTAFGPQLAVIGDNPERKEHILSDSQLERIADSNSGGLIGEFILRGSDLELAVSRALRNMQRIN